MRVSIQLKLIALSTVTIAVIVSFLTSYLTSASIENVRSDRLEHAHGYANMLAAQVRSAVAFSDKETAREVLRSMEDDESIVAIRLYVQDGELLYEHGAPSAWTAQARRGVIERREVTTEDRFAVVMPVTTLEGPRGVLVVELSRASELQQRRTATLTAAVIGLVALAFGSIAAWLTARSLSRRLGAIARVATDIDGDPTLAARVPEGTNDEIGALARAFNGMLERLRDKQQAISVALAELSAAECSLANINRDLEDRVESRTSELRCANERLQEEMEARSAMELELRQAQKLESVGRLAAGIAHELNTPIQFVMDSCTFLDTANSDVLQLFANRHAVFAELEAGTIDIPTAVARIRDAEQDADLEYLLQEVPKATVRAMQGLSRVAAIVGAMKEFAYAEQSARAAADINRGILSTLEVSRNEYKYVADVVTDLGDLPFVMCNIGELNQVMLNLVVNAAHAIGSAAGGEQRRGEIRIVTRADAGCVRITVSDNGCGMSVATRERIFDPFFTTKAIGKGSGQGLAIARAVVEKHGGKLSVESTEHVGTSFTITLPIDVAPAEELRHAS